jgi:hypothetical protein
VPRQLCGGVSLRLLLEQPPKNGVWCEIVNSLPKGNTRKPKKNRVGRPCRSDFSARFSSWWGDDAELVICSGGCQQRVTWPTLPMDGIPIDSHQQQQRDLFLAWG